MLREPNKDIDKSFTVSDWCENVSRYYPPPPPPPIDNYMTCQLDQFVIWLGKFSSMNE